MHKKDDRPTYINELMNKIYHQSDMDIVMRYQKAFIGRLHITLVDLICLNDASSWRSSCSSSLMLSGPRSSPSRFLGFVAEQLVRRWSFDIPVKAVSIVYQKAG